MFRKQTEKSSCDVSVADPVNMDTTGEPVYHNVSHAVSEESLECWPSLIHASSSVILQAEESNIRFVLWASFAEIYNEQIYDLFDSATLSSARVTRPSNLQLRDGDGRPYIRGLREVQVSSYEEVWRLVQIGRENQHIASTRLNRASSRSHSIFTLRLIQVVNVDQPSFARVASLSFCDLAGSERSTASGGCNERIKEAGNINLSLMTLGRCIEALRKNQVRSDQSVAARASIIVPFRNSRLTRLFQSFLCGEGRVVMITNVSPCANVFDETLHAVNYSALASQVVVCPAAPPPPLTTNILPIPAPADKRKVSFLGKHEAAAAAPKAVVEKKRKCDTTIQEEQDDDQFYSDEDVPDLSQNDRQKLLTAIELLKKALDEERESKNAIRAEVCEEMQKQLVRIENKYQESTRRQEEILEEKYDRKMEIYMEAVKKSCKRQRRGDDEDDYIPSVELHAAETKLSQYAAEVSELKNKIAEMTKELATARENIVKLSAERDAVAAKLTKTEFSANDAVRQEKTQARAECVKLRNTVEELQKTIEELTNKLKETEHRHEISCRQLRRDKAQLEQRLKAAESQGANQDQLQEAGTAGGELNKSALQPQTAKITELEAALKKEQDTALKLEQRLKSALEPQTAKITELEAALLKEQDTVHELEQRLKSALEPQTAKITELEAALQKERDTTLELEQCLKSAEDDMKAVEKTWAEHCKQVEAVCQEKTYDLTKLQEKCDTLEHRMQETVKTLEEAKQNEAQIEGMLETARNELRRMNDKETELKESTAVAESLREEINSLTMEAENLRKSLTAKEGECEKLKTEIADLKQQTSAAAGSSQDQVSAVHHDLEVLQEKLKQVEEEKAATLDSLNAEIEKRNAQLAAGKDELSDKVSEIFRLEKELEAEKGSRCQLEDTVADYKKKFDELQANLCEEKEKYLSLQSSLESLQGELNALRTARKTAEDEIADHLSSIASHDAEMERVKEEMYVMKDQLQKCDDREKTLQQQLSSASQLVNESQEKDRIKTAELAEKDQKIQACKAAIGDLMKKSKEEQHKFESMKLTITEQEMTMQTQDQTLRERDGHVQFLEAQLEQMAADYCNESESLNEQIRQKNTRIRELDRELEKTKKSRECLEKDVRDTTSELTTSESNLAKVKNELAHTKQELEKLKSDETDAKSLAKQLYQREQESTNLHKQLKAAQDKLEKRSLEMENLNTQFHALQSDKEKELSKWREERDRLVAKLEKSILEKESEIQHLKAAGKRDKHPSPEERKVEALQKKVEQLSRAASVKDQTIDDMREQNLQLQHQIFELQQQTDGEDADDNPRRRNAPRKSRIPTSRRVPLRVTDGNADISVGVLADGGVAVDLDETVGTSRRSTRRHHISQENSQPKPSDIIEEQLTRATRTRRKRTTGVMDPVESTITEEPEGPPHTRRLRSRHC